MKKKKRKNQRKVQQESLRKEGLAKRVLIVGEMNVGKTSLLMVEQAKKVKQGSYEAVTYITEDGFA